MHFRKFRKNDEDFCFKVRARAFVKFFHKELGPEITSLGIISLAPEDYLKLSREINIFIAEDEGERIGFFSLKKVNESIAEIPLIYFDPYKTGRGYGSAAMNYLENWVRENWPHVKSIFLDTIIPEYNGGFYTKMGYLKRGYSVCRFFTTKVPAVRFEKTLEPA